MLVSIFWNSALNRGNRQMPWCKCLWLFTPFLVLNQQAQHSLDLCGLSQLMTRAKHAGPTVKSLKDDYIAVYFTVGGLCPTIKSLATIYPPLFTILTIGLRYVSRSTRTRSLHPVRWASLLTPPRLGHQTAAKQQILGPRMDESISPPQVNLPMWLNKYFNKLLHSPKVIVTL